MILDCQKSLFTIPEAAHYFNCARLAPQLNSATAAGIEAIKRRRWPENIVREDFFDPVQKVQQLFSKLINNPVSKRIAIFPSTSYGMASVVNNISFQKGDHIVVLKDQFPSNYYPWYKVSKQYGAEMIFVDTSPSDHDPKSTITQRVLDKIDRKTRVVALPQVHWAEGLVLDLAAIRKASKSVDALLIIDGTQSVGAYPFDIDVIAPDALICSSYKWLFGPYGLSLGYFGAYFDNGIPIEESWLNKKESHIFENLMNYQTEYKEKAQRYMSGEHPNHILLPMLHASLEQIIQWKSPSIQDYCNRLMTPFFESLNKPEFEILKPDHRAAHLFCVYPKTSAVRDRVAQKAKLNNISISVRGSAFRISPHVYNDADDVSALIEVFQ